MEQTKKRGLTDMTQHEIIIIIIAIANLIACAVIYKNLWGSK